ncbi:MAG: type II secretion system F family protein [Thermoanaerobaculia bacterium]|nr:type II secretion system F family protein [Thermoanaerobaculia bacterium]
MQYVCRVGTPDGAIVEEVHRAPDAETVRRELRKRGLHVFEVRPRGLPRISLSLPRIGWRKKKKVPLREFLVFNQELAALLGAGLPLLQSLDLMLSRMRHPTFRTVLEDVRERVESGQELSAAFEVHGELFPRLYPSTLKAGERSGDLEAVVRRFVRYLELVLEARKRVISALVYPAVLVVLSIAMIAVMTVYVVPKFSQFYRDLDAELPLITRVTLSVGTFLQERWLPIVGLAIVGWFLFSRWRRTASGRVVLDRLKLRIPVLGTILHQFAISEFSRALATLLQGGLPLVPSLEIAVSATGNAYVREQLTPVIEAVREGRPLHMALEKSGVVENLAIDMVQVGETTGELGTMLTNIADFLDQEVEIQMGRLLSLVEPLMLVFMGIVIALLLVSVYLPMFSVLGQVQG